MDLLFVLVEMLKPLRTLFIVKLYTRVCISAKVISIR